MIFRDREIQVLKKLESNMLIFRGLDLCRIRLLLLLLLPLLRYRYIAHLKLGYFKPFLLTRAARVYY